MNCWPSGKYVHLLYMYSILGRGSFCCNYCLSSAWHGGDQFVALLRWYGSPGFVDSGIQLICIFGLLFLIFLLAIPHRFSKGFRSGEFAGQSSTPTPWSFNQFLVLLAVWAGAKSCWKNKSASFLKAGQQKEAWSAPKCLGKRVQWRWFLKTQWTNTSRWHCTPNHHRLWKLNTGLQATWAMSFSTLPSDSRTFFFGTQRRRSHFFTHRPPLIFPACFLVSSHLLRDSLCTALRTEILWIWSTGLSTQLTPSSRREAWVLGNLTARTERSQLAIRWTRGRSGESYV